MGVSVTDKLDMSQVTVATKKIEKQANIKARDYMNRSMYLNREDDCTTPPRTDH